MRYEAKLTQEEFWARVGITQSGGSRYEAGGRPLPEPVSMLLLLAYGSESERQSVLHALRPGEPAPKHSAARSAYSREQFMRSQA